MPDTPILDIMILDTHDPKTLGIGDISEYPDNFLPVNPSIEIVPPSFPRVVIPFPYRGFSIFNSINLNISCNTGDITELPDGIWSVKYTISPANENFVQKSFLRTEVLMTKFGTALLTTDIKECNEFIKDQDMDILNQIWYIINGAIADANNCNEISAMNKYRYADKLLNNFMRSK